MGLLFVFYNSNKVNCTGALSFYDWKRSIGKVLFLINFIGVNFFEAGNETREKIWSDFVAEQNEEWSEKSGVCSYRCFLESEKLRCEKNSVSERNFLFTCGILKQFFSIFWLRGLLMFFFKNFRLVFVVVQRLLEISWNFMLIRWFFMYFADFWANICVFFCLVGHWNDSYYLSNF